MNQPTDTSILKRAQKVLPGGGLGNFDPSVCITYGKGSRVIDNFGTEFIDLLISSGPMLLGHGHEEVLEAISEQLPKGITFFTNNPPAIELAEEICRAVRCAHQVRYVSSGSEADMYAIRLARAYTGKNKIIKFEGGYHGMSAEAQMSLAPSYLANFPNPVPDSGGIPPSVKNEVLIAPYNDLDSVIQLLSEHENEIAAIIVEPLQRIIPQADNFLAGLRKICTQKGVLLIFDEIVTGFRLAYGGAQEVYGVEPDICTLGKIIGGGLPLAALAASNDIMDCFDKKIAGDKRWLMQLGTLSGNPLASVAGLKTMEILRREGSYQKLYDIGTSIMDHIRCEFTALDIDHQIVGHPTLFDVVFSDRKILNYRDYAAANQKLAARFNSSLREHKILKSPGKIYPSLALSEIDLQIVFEAITKSAASLASQ